MAMATMYDFTLEQHTFPHWKFVFQYCANCTSLVITVK